MLLIGILACFHPLSAADVLLSLLLCTGTTVLILRPAPLRHEEKGE